MTIKVLLVDDNDDFLLLSKKYLEQISDGLDIDVCTSASDALQKMEHSHFDVIVSDYRMPKIDGLEFLRILRDRGFSTPFVVFTGRGREEVAIRALNLGASYYVTKGADVKSQYTQLYHIIKQLSKHATAEKKLVESEERYRSLVHSAPYGIAVHKNYKLVFANQYSLNILGIGSIHEIQNKSILELAHPDSREFIEKRIRSIYSEATETQVVEQKWIRPDGSTMYVEVVAKSIEYEGEPASLVMFHDITARKESEQVMEKSDQRYRDLFDELPIGIEIMTYDPYMIIYANRAMEDITEFTSEELIGMSWNEILSTIHPEDAKKVSEYFQRRIVGEPAPNNYQIRGTRKDGSTIWLDITASNIEFQGKSSSLVIFRDITKQKEIEQRLKITEIKYHEIFNSISSGIYVYELNEKDELILVDGNPAAAIITGVEPKECIGLDFDTIWPEAKKSGITDEYLKVAKTGEPFSSEAFYYQDEHTEGVFKITVTRLPDGRICSLFEDIKEMIEMERNLSYRIDELNTLYQCTRELNRSDKEFDSQIEEILRVLPQGLLKEITKYVRIVINGEEWKSSGFQKLDDCFVTSIEVSGQSRGFIELKRSKSPPQREFGDRSSDETLVEALSEQIAQTLARIEAEQRIRESELRYRTLVQSFRDLVFVYDENDRIIEFYASGPDLLYTQPENFLGKTMNQVLPDYITNQISEHLERTRKTGSSLGFDYQLEIQDEKKWFTADFMSHEIEGQVVSVVREITERKMQETALENQSRELSRLAHRMHHDLSTLHGNVMAYLELMDSNDEEYITGIKKTINRAQNILARSVELADSGQVIGDREDVDLSLLVQEIGRASVPRSMTIEVGTLPVVKGDKEKIEQVVLNLINNAVIHGKPSRIWIGTEVTDCSTIIQFCNNGEKIDEGTKEALFQDSLKSSIRKGLGLSIAKRIVLAHGWDIYLEDDENTCFCISIPRNDIIV